MGGSAMRSAYALPYDDMLQGSMAGRAGPLFGASWSGSAGTDAGFPQPMPFQTDLGKAKQLLTECGISGWVFDDHLIQHRERGPKRSIGGAGQGVTWLKLA